MMSDKTPNTTDLIREIQRLVRLADDLSGSAREMGAELDRLQQLLGVKQMLLTHAYPARSGRPN